MGTFFAVAIPVLAFVFVIAIVEENMLKVGKDIVKELKRIADALEK